MIEPVDERFVRDLVQAVPELAPELQEHLEDNFGEMLPHLFFGDVVRWVEAQGTTLSPATDRLLAFLEKAYPDATDYVRELLVVSFFEDLEADSPVWARLGPFTAASARTYQALSGRVLQGLPPGPLEPNPGLPAGGPT